MGIKWHTGGGPVMVVDHEDFVNIAVKDRLLDLSKVLLYSTTMYPNYERLYEKLYMNVCTYSKHCSNGQVSKHSFH